MKHIPNLLSGFRVVLIPFFAKAYLRGNTTTAILLVAISGLTDFLDGYLARKYNWITPLGKVLDPAADKLTLIAVSVVLAYTLREHRIFFIILLVKDFIMILIGGYFLRKDIKLEGAKWLGKIATAAFYVGIIILGVFPNVSSRGTTLILVVITILELVALFSYIPEAKGYFSEIQEERSRS